MSQSDRDLLAEAVAKNVRELDARRDIVREGERPRGVIAILDGWASRYKQLPDGRRQITSFVIPGDLCDANVFILTEMDHSIGSVTRVRYAEVAPADFEQMMTASSRLTEALWWHALVVAGVQREWTTNVGQRSAHERLAHLLCELFCRLEAIGQTDGDTCPLPLTQMDLADATGLTPVHVNRTIQGLRRAGLIQLGNRRLRIPDLQALMRVALFNPNYLHLQESEGRPRG